MQRSQKGGFGGVYVCFWWSSSRAFVHSVRERQAMHSLNLPSSMQPPYFDSATPCVGRTRDIRAVKLQRSATFGNTSEAAPATRAHTHGLHSDLPSLHHPPKPKIPLRSLSTLASPLIPVLHPVASNVYARMCVGWRQQLQPARVKNPNFSASLLLLGCLCNSRGLNFVLLMDPRAMRLRTYRCAGPFVFVWMLEIHGDE